MGLFGKKNETDPEPTTAPLPMSGIKSGTTFLGQGLSVQGRIGGQDDVVILGSHEGEIEVNGQLEIQEEANVRGHIRAKTMLIKGRVEGSIVADQKLNIFYTARITGSITTPVISVQEVAEFEGEVKMHKSGSE